MKKKETLIDFDDYVDTYEGVLKNQLGFFVNNRDYYSEYKVNIAAEICSKRSVDRILDFGCGIGLSFPFLKKYFPDSILFGSDTSAESLNYVKQNFDYVEVIESIENSKIEFDLIFITGVFHHIEINDRPDVIKLLFRLLKKNGKLIVFEHNPYNPLTRRIVSNCEFDADANLISQTALKNLFRNNSKFSVSRCGYTLFFPEFMGGLRAIERRLRWLPLGGQYFVVAEKL